MTETKHGTGFTIDTKSITPEGRFEGYASVYGVVDSHKDIVVKSAFSNSLRKRPADRVKMLYQHQQDQPIGKWLSLVEDDRGLKATGQLILGTAKGAEAYELMKAGVLDLSIGFRTVRDRIDRTKGARILEEIDLLEISAVTFASNDQATITSVKSNHSTKFRALVEMINSARSSLNS